MSKPNIKTPAQIERMRRSGALAASLLDMVAERIAPGISTGDIDDWCARAIEDAGAIAAPLNYAPAGHKPFPKSICTSVNHQVCHGIPSHETKLKDGDIVNVDVTVILDGYYADCSRMYQIGNASQRAQELCATTEQCLKDGIAAAVAGNDISAIGQAIESRASAAGCSVVQEYCGHGIGACFHEPPQVLHYVSKQPRLTLRENMTFTIEPMINAGKQHIKVLADGWTVVTRDRQLSAQWEHTILVTDGPAEILTQ